LNASGKALNEIETTTLEPHQGYTIPRWVMHRIRAPERSAILMVEGSGFLGRALLGGCRDKVKLATKLFPLYVERHQDFDRLLDEQLEKLQTDHVDFYLLHGLNQTWWPKLRALGIFDWAEGAIADGRFSHLGFSFHDEYPVFQEIIDAYDTWSMCQIQYNYVNGDYQAGTRGLRYAAARGLAVVIMEPLLGGQLANAPQAVQALWDTAHRKRTPVDWALQWLWNQLEVSVVLSGMSTMQRVEENVASAAASRGRRLDRGGPGAHRPGA
jgi:predicted aldo/keto reductase-like oxidoreductase